MTPPRALLVALLAALATVVAAPGATTALVPAGPEAPVNGSARGGDPYFPWDGNGGYDVEHYRIVTTITPRTGKLRGTTRVTARAGEAALRSLSLDLVLTPDWVRVDGRRARFHKPRAHELRVRPASPIAAGSTFEVVVRYHGQPARRAAAGVSPFLWAPGEAMAIGEPQIGPWWFAANEHPSDKASYDVTIRVPRGQQGISSGRLVRRTVSGRRVAWRWRQDTPIATYLAFLAAGSFEMRHRVVEGRPTVYAVSRKLGKAQRARSFRLLERTPAVVAWLEGWLGDYPYETSGGVVSGLYAGFALENAGRPTYPYVGGPGSRWNESLLVHEMAHQWFGNDVSLRRWRDIWLNEGLASYAEWAYGEQQWGDDVHRRLLDEYDRRGASSGFWRLRLSDPGPVRLFDPPVYDRGAMTVAALRCRIGATQLDELLRSWVSGRAGGHGTVADFRALAEDVSGQDLDAFFDAWLDTTAKPAPTSVNGLDACET